MTTNASWQSGIPTKLNTQIHAHVFGCQPPAQPRRRTPSRCQRQDLPIPPCREKLIQHALQDVMSVRAQRSSRPYKSEGQGAGSRLLLDSHAQERIFRNQGHVPVTGWGALDYVRIAQGNWIHKKRVFFRPVPCLWRALKTIYFSRGIEQHQNTRTENKACCSVSVEESSNTRI